MIHSNIIWYLYGVYVGVAHGQHLHTHIHTPHKCTYTHMYTIHTTVHAHTTQTLPHTHTHIHINAHTLHTHTHTTQALQHKHTPPTGRKITCQHSHCNKYPMVYAGQEVSHVSTEIPSKACKHMLHTILDEYLAAI